MITIATPQIIVDGVGSISVAGPYVHSGKWISPVSTEAIDWIAHEYTFTAVAPVGYQCYSFRVESEVTCASGSIVKYNQSYPSLTVTTRAGWSGPDFGVDAETIGSWKVEGADETSGTTSYKVYANFAPISPHRFTIETTNHYEHGIDGSNNSVSLSGAVTRVFRAGDVSYAANSIGDGSSIKMTASCYTPWYPPGMQFRKYIVTKGSFVEEITSNPTTITINADTYVEAVFGCGKILKDANGHIKRNPDGSIAMC